MTITDTISILAVLLSPIIAVQITRYFDSKNATRNIKLEIFRTLMSQRGLYPRTSEFLMAVNQIDIAYYDNPKVIEQWKKFYDVTSPNHPEIVGGTIYLNEMLIQMAKVLKFENLNSIDIGKYYSTQQRADDLNFQRKYYDEFYRVLKNSENFGVKREEDLSGN